MRSALQALQRHLEAAQPYEDVDVPLFNHGVRSEGVLAAQDGWTSHAAPGARLLGVRTERFPADIASAARHGPALERLPAATKPWSPVPINKACARLEAAGQPVTLVTAGFTPDGDIESHPEGDRRT